MIRLLLSVSILVCVVQLIPAQTQPPVARPPQPEKPRPTVIEIPLSSKAPAPGRALRYALFPEAMSVVPGNAAPHWVRAGLAAVQATRRVSEKDWSALEDDVPLAKLPRDEARKVLDGAATALRLAEQASRYEFCHWEYEPLTIQSLDLPLPEIQELRTLARLLSLRCRLLLAQRRFDEAASTLQTGLALAHDTGEAPILIQNLVGVAIAQIMLHRVEEWMQMPDAPELYWPLTALPAPFISAAAAIRNEAALLYRSFPKLRTLATEKLSKEQAESVATELMRSLRPLTQDKGPPEWQMRLGLAVLAARVYPDAKRFLSDRGRTSEEIEAMPALQVTLLYTVEEYDELWDDVFKWIYLPYWQARPGLEEFEKRIRAARSDNLNVFVGLLMPAILKVQTANTRSDRTLATLRCVEAIRADAARHGGRPPAALKDLTSVPLPTDPVTGKGFDAFYKVEDGGAMLDVPPMPHDVVPGRRYVFIAPTK
jgi:hypothetical protein